LQILINTVGLEKLINTVGLEKILNSLDPDELERILQKRQKRTAKKK